MKYDLADFSFLILPVKCCKTVVNIMDEVKVVNNL